MRTRTLLNPFSCFQRFNKQNWHEVFPNFTGKLDVEIGCGNGAFLINYALKNKHRNLVGFEIKERLVAFIKQKIAVEQLNNAHVFWGNGQIGLEDIFEDASIDRIFIFHPDPWPKTAHQKRRLVNQELLTLVQRKLKSNGQLYLSTDVPELWDYMITTVENSQLFVRDEDEEFWATLYQTRWHEMSQLKQKQLSYATYKVIK